MPPTDPDRLIAELPSTPDEAWGLLAFGFHCILCTPVGPERAPSLYFRGKAVFDDAFWLVEAFLSGRPCVGELEQADEAVFRAAVSRAGLFRNDLTGPAAAYWAVSWLVQAALASADKRRAGHVRGIATLVARLCRQVEPAAAEEAAAFQARLAEDFGLVAPESAAAGS